MARRPRTRGATAPTCGSAKWARIASEPARRRAGRRHRRRPRCRRASPASPCCGPPPGPRVIAVADEPRPAADRAQRRLPGRPNRRRRPRRRHGCLGGVDCHEQLRRGRRRGPSTGMTTATLTRGRGLRGHAGGRDRQSSSRRARTWRARSSPTGSPSSRPSSTWAPASVSRRTRNGEPPIRVRPRVAPTGTGVETQCDTSQNPSVTFLLVGAGGRCPAERRRG